MEESPPARHGASSPKECHGRAQLPADPAEFALDLRRRGAVAEFRPGSILELWTEDAFEGRVRGPDDLVSRVVEFPFVNPQTGPFYVEGAEPGDTLAVHFVSIEPSRDWAASSTIPLFEALTGTHVTALLNEPLPEVVWVYEVDQARRTVTFHAAAATWPSSCSTRCAGPSGSRRPPSRPARRWSPTPTAATWIPPRCRPGPPAAWA